MTTKTKKATTKLANEYQKTLYFDRDSWEYRNYDDCIYYMKDSGIDVLRVGKYELVEVSEFVSTPTINVLEKVK